MNENKLSFLKEAFPQYKVRGWNHKHNFNAKFVRMEDGSISIEKTYI